MSAIDTSASTKNWQTIKLSELDVFQWLAVVTLPRSLSLVTLCRNVVNAILNFCDVHSEQSIDSDRWVEGWPSALRKQARSQRHQKHEGQLGNLRPCRRYFETGRSTTERSWQPGTETFWRPHPKLCSRLESH